MVQDRFSRSEREAPAASRRAVGGCRQVRQHRLAHLQAYLPVLAGRNRSTDGSAAEAYAARPNLDHDERVRQRADGSKARGKRSSRKQDFEERITHEGERPNVRKPGGANTLALTPGYSGLEVSLSGCGGRI